MFNQTQKGFSTPLIITIIVLVIIVGGVAYLVSTRNAPPADEPAAVSSTHPTAPASQKTASPAPAQAGSYSAYDPSKLALAESGQVLLYFHAPWCPICRAIEGEINANPSAIPAGVHILKIDYDTATALRQKYGVTTQHTFVQVNSAGDALQKWNDSSTLAQVLAHVK